MTKKLTAEQYHATASHRGFKWVGRYVPTALEKTQWECANGHVWSAAYHDVSRKNGCPYCSRQAPKTMTDYADAANKRGYFWIGTLPSSTHHKTLWQCQRGHEWKQTYANIVHNKSTCPHCNRETQGMSRRLNASDYHALATSRGFMWLGVNAETTATPTLWQCSLGHQWKAKYNNVLTGTNCPHCENRINGQPVSKPQQQLANMTGGVLNYPVGRYRIDVALPHHSIALEYDGWYWHQRQDRKRNNQLQTLGWKVLRIQSGVLLPTIEQVYDAITRLLNGEQYIVITLSDWREVS